jgi:hypothetical protein
MIDMEAEYQFDAEAMSMDEASRKILREIEKKKEEYFLPPYIWGKQKKIDDRMRLKNEINELRQKFIVHNMHYLFGY